MRIVSSIVSSLHFLLYIIWTSSVCILSFSLDLIFNLFLIPCLLFLTVLDINSDDTFTLWLDSSRFNARSWIQQNRHYYKAILLTQCKMKFIVWGHVLSIFFYSHSQNIILWLVFISPVNVPNYFRIIYQDHLWYLKCRYTYVLLLYLFKNSFSSDIYYYLMMLVIGFIFVSTIS